MSDHINKLGTVEGSQTSSCIREHLSHDEIEFFRKFLQAFDSMSKKSAPPTGEDTIIVSRLPSMTVPPNINLTWVNNYYAYKEKSEELKREVEELSKQLKRISGYENKAVIREFDDTTFYIYGLDKALISALKSENPSMAIVMRRLNSLSREYSDLLETLYRQKHAFRYLHRSVKDLQDARTKLSGIQIISSLQVINIRSISLLLKEVGTKATLFEEVVPSLTSIFIDIKRDFRSFSDKTLPAFVNEEEERATTRYLNLTTVATFFSSVTATTLQFSYTETTDGLSNAVNLCWFLSLVFSVSSGVNSLMSMLWRKSAVYSEERTTPVLFKLWFTDAPIMFLAISALLFIVGLNLFAYSSHQSTQVATITSAFTALHVLGLLIVIPWFLFRLSWTSIPFQRMRRNVYWVLNLDNRLYEINLLIAGLNNWNTIERLKPHPLLRFARKLSTWCRYILRPFRALFGYMVDLMKTSIASVREAVSKISHGMRSQPKNLSARGGGNSDAAEREEDRVQEDAYETIESVLAAVGEVITKQEVLQTIKEFLTSMSKTFDERTAPGIWNYYMDHLCAWGNQEYTANALERDGNYFLWGYPDLQTSLNRVLVRMWVEEELRQDPAVRKDPSQGSESTSSRKPEEGNEYPLAPEVVTRHVGRGTKPVIPSIGGDGGQDISNHSLQEQKKHEISVLVTPEDVV